MDRDDASTSSKAAPPLFSFSTPTNTDDESLNTSTASESFESWTLVSDKKTKKSNHGENIGRHIEILTTKGPEEKGGASEEEEDKGEREEEQLNIQKPEHHDLDDISDGISIISESDSAGRLSPHSFLREPLELNLDFGMPKGPIRLTASALSAHASNFEGVSDDNADTQQALRQRHRNRSTSPNARNRALQRTPEAANGVLRAAGGDTLPCFVRRGLSVIFYVSVTLVVLVFVGQLRFDDIKELAAERGYGKAMPALEAKLNDLELQNNLMRAEIDILAKQVNYLNSLNQGTAKPASGAGKTTFKAWSGNGDAADPSDVTKSDLKRPYKCANGKFVKIAGMCVENRGGVNDIPVLNQQGYSEHSIFKEPQSVPQFSKSLPPPAEHMPYLKIKLEPVDEDVKNEVKDSVLKHYKRKNNPADKAAGHNSNAKTFAEEAAVFMNLIGDEILTNPNNSLERFVLNEIRKIRQRHQENSKSAEDDEDEDDNSGEERRNRKLQQKRKLGARSGSASYEHDHDKDGRWQEKLAHHRETARRENEQRQDNNIAKNKKNWYIKRGSSREQQRDSSSGEQTRFS